MRRAPLLVLLAVLLALPAAAQNTDIEALSGLQFSFGNPGARALGMGGAFLGLADDASAAEANPAGLTILRTREVSVETRHSQTTQTFNVAGVFPDLESEDFLSYSRRVPVTFASVVTPIGDNFSIAAFFHSPIEFESDVFPFDQPIRFYLGPNGPITEDQCFGALADCQPFDLTPFLSVVNIRLQTYGLAGAWKVGKLSLGLAGRYQRFEESAASIRIQDFDFTPLFLSQQTSDDDDLTISAGFKYDIIPDKFSVGGVYKQGAEFDTELSDFDFTDGTSREIGTPPFHIPDSYGIGFSFRPVGQLTINADAIQVNYSNLTDDFQTVLDLTPEEQLFFEADDVTEIHVGAEYVFLTRIPVAVRVGWWRDPAHAITYNGPLLTSGAIAARILYPGSEDQDHVTGGIGLLWPKFQINAAYDTSDTYKVGSLSAVFQF